MRKPILLVLICFTTHVFAQDSVTTTDTTAAGDTVLQKNESGTTSGQAKPDSYFFFKKLPDRTNTPKQDFVQYTDFLGFSNDRPNGLLQQEYLFKWPLVKSKWLLGKKEKSASIQPFRSIVLPRILLNRIEKAKDDSSLLYPAGYAVRLHDSAGTLIGDTSLSKVISTFDLLRYMNLRLETRLNLVTFQIDNTRIYIDAHAGLMRNRIKDTLLKKEDQERPLTSFAWGLNLYVKSLLPAKDLNIELRAGFNKIRLMDNFFQQYDAFATEFGPHNTRAFIVGENYGRTSKPIWIASVMLYKDWGKEGDGDKKNNAFFRIQYHLQNGKETTARKDRPFLPVQQTFYNHFLQLQLGISLSLNKLFNN